MNSFVGKFVNKTFTVENKDTAKSIGSGGFKVLATPSLVIWAENLAYNLLNQFLEEGQSSVGIYFQIDHLAPTAVGDKVELEVEIKEQHKRIVTFDFKASASGSEIAHGVHKRAIVEEEKFLAKLNNNG